MLFFWRLVCVYFDELYGFIMNLINIGFCCVYKKGFDILIVLVLDIL